MPKNVRFFMNKVTKFRHQPDDRGEPPNDMQKEGQKSESPHKLPIVWIEGHENATLCAFTLRDQASSQMYNLRHLLLILILDLVLTISQFRGSFDETSDRLGVVISLSHFTQSCKYGHIHLRRFCIKWLATHWLRS